LPYAELPFGIQLNQLLPTSKSDQSQNSQKYPQDFSCRQKRGTD
jgi:hypothetical protein